MLKAVALASLLLLSGCMAAIETFSPEQRAKLNSMKHYANTEGLPPFDIIGTAKGYSCQKSVIVSSITTEEAISDLKISAVEMNGDAVVNIACQTINKVDMRLNCWNAIICIGDVIRFK